MSKITIQDIQAHYDKTIGAFQTKVGKLNPLIGRIQLNRTTACRVVDVNFHVSVHETEADEFRECVRAFFKKYLIKTDVIRCWFSGYNKRIHIVAQVQNWMNLFDTVQFENGNLRLVLDVVDKNKYR
jgi:hypothetical protein